MEAWKEAEVACDLAGLRRQMMADGVSGGVGTRCGREVGQGQQSGHRAQGTGHRLPQRTHTGQRIGSRESGVGSRESGVRASEVPR